ncbi:hypothetical protein K501DRAFT_272433 [Backusella circina FSU 941]|nr:hypothetical protein K501DRAFT_272433 [Backusella circina FSU 941]
MVPVDTLEKKEVLSKVSKVGKVSAGESKVSLNQKKLDELPPLLNNYLEDLKKQQDIDALKTKLSEETDCSACEWARCTVLEYLRLFKYQYLPLLDQTEGDMMRRIWFFIDTLFDSSSIQCRGGEKSSKASSISRNAERILSGIDKIRRKMVGRKVDLLFLRQSLEYCCCECGRYDDATKELNNSDFKMTKVLKDMLHCIYKSAPNVLRDVVLPGFVLFARHLARNAPATIQFDQMPYKMLSPCYHPEVNKQKRRRNSSDED